MNGHLAPLGWVLAVLTAVAACGGSGNAPTVTPTAPQVSSSDGTLTQAGRESVEKIVREDPVITEIAGDVPYTLQDFGPWYAGTVPDTGEDIFIGGIATVVLSRPIGHIERDWPNAGARPYYSRGLRRPEPSTCRIARERNTML